MGNISDRDPGLRVLVPRSKASGLRPVTGRCKAQNQRTKLRALKKRVFSNGVRYVTFDVRRVSFDLRRLTFDVRRPYFRRLMPTANGLLPTAISDQDGNKLIEHLLEREYKKEKR